VGSIKSEKANPIGLAFFITAIDGACIELYPFFINVLSVTYSKYKDVWF
jgi:hypothetical protein